ncbi:MAG: TldD/PmbA family protein [Planctomycetes bacterium]|nr:TldD/PmbA family protein [Planctomycetota bacterium]
MKSVTEIQKLASEALSIISQAPDVVEAEVFVSTNEKMIGRVDYKSDIPCNGLQEPKSMQAQGIGVSVLLDDHGVRKLGFGSEKNDLTQNGILSALEKARVSSVHDPDFKSFAHPASTQPMLEDYADPHVMNITEEEFVRLGWEALRGSLEVYGYDKRGKSIVVGGDITILKERIAVANTRGISEHDESSICLAGITSMLEDENVKGSGYASSTHLSQFGVRSAGAEAAHQAIYMIGGERLPAGNYTVIFGPQPVADFMEHLVSPSLKLSSMDASASMFCGKLGQQIASPLISIYDDGSLPGLVGSKRITCEGLPTGRTDLITNGVLTGFLTNTYYSNKCSNNFRRYQAKSGFRFSGGGRDFNSTPGISATNIVIQGSSEKGVDDIIRDIDEGLYIGRIWYTYPVNGMAAGDFTCTVVGDSYFIKNGRKAGTIKPNTLRINDNIKRVLKNIFDVSHQRRPIIGWASEEVVFAPCIAVNGVPIDSIGGSLDDKNGNGS